MKKKLLALFLAAEKVERLRAAGNLKSPAVRW